MTTDPGSPSTPEPAHGFTDASRGKRLQRVLADAGVAARRACERLIEQGLVTVNGTIVSTLPAWVDPENDRIEVEGKVLAQPERPVYIMLNKPKRTLSTVTDEPGALRKTVVDLVDHPASPRLFPVGRLDFDTMGLVLLTNDGELANKLTHPRFGVAKTYHLVVKGRLDEEQIAELERGIFLAERRHGKTVGAVRTSHVELDLITRDADRTVLALTLREGRNRQVRRMLAAVGCQVRKLERIAMGPLKLKGLRRGEWRELSAEEVRQLKRASAAGKSPPPRARPPKPPRRFAPSRPSPRPSRGPDSRRGGPDARRGRPTDSRRGGPDARRSGPPSRRPDDRRPGPGPRPSRVHRDEVEQHGSDRRDRPSGPPFGDRPRGPSRRPDDAPPRSRGSTGHPLDDRPPPPARRGPPKGPRKGPARGGSGPGAYRDSRGPGGGSARGGRRDARGGPAQDRRGPGGGPGRGPGGKPSRGPGGRPGGGPNRGPGRGQGPGGRGPGGKGPDSRGPGGRGPGGGSGRGGGPGRPKRGPGGPGRRSGG